jgi:hypothetical protein
VLAALCASLLAAAAPPKLGAFGFDGLGMTPDELHYYSDHFAHLLAVQGLTLVTKSDLSAVIGLERQKELMGCTGGGSSCLAELSAAIGVDGLVLGSIAHTGDNFQLDIKVIAINDARSLSVYSRRVRGTQALLDQLELAAAQVAFEVMRAIRPELLQAPQPAAPANLEPPPAAPGADVPPVYVGPALEPVAPVHLEAGPRSRGSALGWLPIAVGAILVTVSVGLLAVTASRYETLTDPDSTDLAPGMSAVDFANGGAQFQTSGYVCLSVGVAALVAGIIMLAVMGHSS